MFDNMLTFINIGNSKPPCDFAIFILHEFLKCVISTTKTNNKMAEATSP